MTDEFEENVFEVMDDLRGDNRVAVPDVGTIRRRAGKQQNRMRAAGGAACLAVIAAVGVGVWASIGDSPASTETAGADQEVVEGLPAVGSDSAPVEVGGEQAEQLVKWMELEDLQTSDRAFFVRATSSVLHPEFDEVRLNLGAFRHDGAHEFFLIVSAGCGPKLSHGMIELEGETARYRRNQLPESTNIGFDDIGYECKPSQPERLNKILAEGFTLSTGRGGLSIANDSDRLVFALTDMSYEPKSQNTTIDDPAPTSVEIVTGEPEGGRGWNALSSFTLRHDPDLNCLYHDAPDNNGEPGTGGRVVIVWPAEYTAARNEAGVAVRNPAGDVVARSGETFQIGGGMRTGGSGHCDSIGEWIANEGPKSEVEQEPVPMATTDFSSTPTGDWTVQSVVVDGVELLHPTNAQTLAIMDGTVSANDGCNTWSGPSQWDGSGLFTLSGNSTGTARACVNGQENADAFNAALRATIRWAVTSDGVLLLISPTSLIELT